MTKRFNDLVSDLERMNVPTASSSATASPVPARAAGNRYPQTISLTQSLHMDKATKPSSLYEPYWRQHSWLSRRYGLEGNAPRKLR